MLTYLNLTLTVIKRYVQRLWAFAVLNVSSTETEGSVAVSGVARGKLSNYKILANLDSYLSVLNPSKRTDII